MAKNSFTDKDMGWDKLVTSFETHGGESAVFVGFLRSSGVYKPKAKDGKAAKGTITMAQLGAIHEFGSSDGRIPERSFMRSSVDASKKKLETMLSKLSAQVLDGKMGKKQALGLVGTFVQNLFRAKITAGVPPPNKPSTVKRKGSSKPLVDTGQLLGAIDFEVKEAKTGGKA